MKVPIQLANYTKKQDPQPKTQIRLMNLDGSILAEKSGAIQEVKPGNKNFLASFEHTFSKTGIPRQLVLEIAVGEFTNEWNIWVYPKPKSHEVEVSKNLRILTQLTADDFEFLKNGGSVLLSLGKGKVTEEFGGNIGVGFSSIFWNTAWTGGQKPHTLGILCNPNHPALNDFPTNFHSDWQWWDAMSNADAIQLDGWADQHSPLVRIIDDWVSNRQLALVMEARVGKGKIIISGADLHTNLDLRVAARQLQTSLLNYLGSDHCDPGLIISKDQLRAIITR